MTGMGGYGRRPSVGGIPPHSGHAVGSVELFDSLTAQLSPAPDTTDFASRKRYYHDVLT